MKKMFFFILVFLIAGTAYAEVGVSVGVGQPGFYGQIVIGSAPPPELLYPSPVIIQPAPGPPIAPIYLYVPPYQTKDWRRYCAQYNACGRPVYFVRQRWYNNVYVPHYRKHPEEYRRGGPGHREEERERGGREERERR